MTDAEDERNRLANERIARCDHEPVRIGKTVLCRQCGARFAVLLKPRRLEPIPITDRENDK